MKKNILAAIFLATTFSFAQYESEPYGLDQSASGTNNPQTEYSANHNNFENTKNDLYAHTHRGFYFSTGLSIAYQSSEHHEKYGYNDKEEKTNANGLLHPYEEIRIGGSIAGIASIYGLIGGGVGSGKFERKSTKDYEDNYKVDATLLKFQFGIGAEFYPIQEKESPLHGLFLGFAFGFAVDGAFYDTPYRNSSYDDYDAGNDGYPYLFYRFEIGNDFWFSKRWSCGVAFSYTYGSFTDENSGYKYDDETDTCTGHTFGLTIRISH